MLASLFVLFPWLLLELIPVFHVKVADRGKECAECSSYLTNWPCKFVSGAEGVSWYTGSAQPPVASMHKWASHFKGAGGTEAGRSRFQPVAWASRLGH